MTTDDRKPAITFPDELATVHEVRRWQATGELPRRLVGPDQGPAAHSTLMTQILKVVRNG